MLIDLVYIEAQSVVKTHYKGKAIELYKEHL